MEKQEVIELMKSSKNSKEWNENCDKVKKDNNNDYPFFVILYSNFSSFTTNDKFSGIFNFKFISISKYLGVYSMGSKLVQPVFSYCCYTNCR